MRFLQDPGDVIVLQRREQACPPHSPRRLGVIRDHNQSSGMAFMCVRGHLHFASKFKFMYLLKERSLKMFQSDTTVTYSSYIVGAPIHFTVPD